MKQLIGFEKMERNSLFSTCVLIQEKIYSFTSLTKIPIEIDIHTGKMDFVKNMIKYDPTFSPSCSLNSGEEIFVLESNGNRLMRFDLYNRTCEYIVINCNKKEWGNYAVAAKYGDCFYVFPVYCDAIVKVDLRSGRVQRKKDLYLKIINQERNLVNKIEFAYFTCGYQSKNIVWLMSKQGNLLVAYNMENDTWKEYILSVKINDGVHLLEYDNKLYILSSEGELYSWDIKKEQIEKIFNCSENERKQNTFFRIAVTDKIIYILPYLGKDIFRINRYTKNIEKYELYPKNFKYCEIEWSKYYEYCEDDNNYYFAMRSANFILTLNKKSGKERWIKPEFLLYDEWIKAYVRYNKNLLNEKFFDLKSLVKYLNMCLVHEEKENNVYEGKKIWRQI